MAIFYPRIGLDLLSEKRVSFKFSYEYEYNLLFATGHQFKQIASYDKSNLTSTITEDKARQSSRLELFVRVETNASHNSYFFLRTRYFWQSSDLQTSAQQVQIGYNINIIYRK